MREQPKTKAHKLLPLGEKIKIVVYFQPKKKTRGSHGPPEGGKAINKAHKLLL